MSVRWVSTMMSPAIALVSPPPLLPQPARARPTASTPARAVLRMCHNTFLYEQGLFGPEVVEVKVAAAADEHPDGPDVGQRADVARQLGREVDLDGGRQTRVDPAEVGLAPGELRSGL